MTREALIDLVRAELRRQELSGKLFLSPTDIPDVLAVYGRIDLHVLATMLIREWGC